MVVRASKPVRSLSLGLNPNEDPQSQVPIHASIDIKLRHHSARQIRHLIESFSEWFLKRHVHTRSKVGNLLLLTS